MNNGRLIILAIGLKGAWATTTRERIIVEQGLLTLPTHVQASTDDFQQIKASLLRSSMYSYTILFWNRIIRKRGGGLDYLFSSAMSAKHYS